MASANRDSTVLSLKLGYRFLKHLRPEARTVERAKMCQSKLPTTLVVDDEASTRVFLKEVLMAEGYDVSAAESGPLALAFAADSRPELILLDVRMPGMDGFEVCRKLKADVGTRNIPVIIFLSASDQLEERVQGLRIGAVGFVAKPVKPEEQRNLGTMDK